ncbi:DUF6274 family protein [Streptomyces marispadix]|uniref:DUF6274 family protein n=1 Tax=Streptomyces marispadix TaxID=2922868 RepID=A0ABS9SYS9_9ACTN|nr:DUF6274 family protein [Streptomyces marispadix]MCH6161196.1 DUF6274 family protein [Streptomyces marispadix]
MGTTPRGPRRHETRALLRAHLAAATRYRHVTRNCPVCHRLLRLATEHVPEEAQEPPHGEANEGTAMEAVRGASGAPAAERRGAPDAEPGERPAKPRRVSASK